MISIEDSWDQHQYSVIDIEGNGAHPPDIVEIAIVVASSETILNTFSSLIKPSQKITYFATKIHGIKNHDVIDCPVFEDVSKIVFDLIDKRIVVAHNSSTDMSIISKKVPDAKPFLVLDTLKISRKLFPDLKSHKLYDLVEMFKITCPELEGTPHRAKYDAVNTLKLFYHLVKSMDAKPTLFELASLQNSKNMQKETLFNVEEI